MKPHLHINNNKLCSDFDLIETLLWENSAYFLFDLHMERLKKSVQHFTFSCDEAGIIKVFEKFGHSFEPSKKYRVRLILKKSGEFKITPDILPSCGVYPLKAIISKERTDKNDIFLYHKTTNRRLYDQELKKYRKKGFFDVIFSNRQNEITEGAITNIIIRKGKKYFTPPLSCGILDGVYRRYLMESTKLAIEEKKLFHEDLVSADKIFLVNSVRKFIPVVLSN